MAVTRLFVGNDSVEGDTSVIQGVGVEVSGGCSLKRSSACRRSGGSDERSEGRTEHAFRLKISQIAINKLANDLMRMRAKGKNRCMLNSLIKWCMDDILDHWRIGLAN